MHADTNIEGDHSCHECRSYEREVKALKSKLGQAVEQRDNAMRDAFQKGLRLDTVRRYCGDLQTSPNMTGQAKRIAAEILKAIDGCICPGWCFFNPGQHHENCKCTATIHCGVVERQAPNEHEP